MGFSGIFNKASLIGTVLLAALLITSTGFAADRLVIKDSSTNTTFSVQDTGQLDLIDASDGSTAFQALPNGELFIDRRYKVQGITPAFWLDETEVTSGGANFVLDGGVFQIQSRASNFGAFTASPFKIELGAKTDSLSIKNAGSTNAMVGIGKAPGAVTYPLHMASGAHVTIGGVWTDASSRELKQDIKELNAQEAMDTFMRLTPVTYQYKAEPDEDHVGFIAEDVPDLVATNDRKSLSPMDIVATLTKVVQEQQKMIEDLTKKMETLEKANQ